MKPIVSAAVQYLLPAKSGDEVQVAVMHYTKGYGAPKARRSTRIPVETIEPTETVRDGLHRGILDEVAKDRTLFKFEIGSWFFAEFGRDQRNPNGLHLKVAFEITSWKGDLRDFSQLDNHDPDEYHGPIKFVEVYELLAGTGNRPPLLYSHGRTITSYLRLQANTNDDIAWKYSSILDLFPSHELSEEELQAVEGYLRSH